MYLRFICKLDNTVLISDSLNSIQSCSYRNVDEKARYISEITV